MADEEKTADETPEIPVVEAIHLNGGVIKIEKIPGLRTMEWMRLEEEFEFGPRDAGDASKLTMKVLHEIATMGLTRYDAKLTGDMVSELDFFELMAVTNHVLAKRRPTDFTKSSTA